MYGTDSTQLQRHLRFRELLLVQLACYALPMEVTVTKIVGEEGDEYARLEGTGLCRGTWVKASDMQVIAVLATPPQLKMVDPNQFVAPDWNQNLQDKYDKYMSQIKPPEGE